LFPVSIKILRAEYKTAALNTSGLMEFPIRTLVGISVWVKHDFSNSLLSQGKNEYLLFPEL
jgi:hypothetical protein